MTAYSDLRDAITTVLETVPNIGVVHDRERFVVDPSRYLDLFKTNIGGKTQLRAWMVLRERASYITDGAFNEIRMQHGFILYGILGFEDASDTYATLQGLADAVMAVLDAQSTLDVGGVIVGQVGPCSMRAFRTEQFGSALCHACEISVPIDVALEVGTA